MNYTRLVTTMLVLAALIAAMAGLPACSDQAAAESGDTDSDSDSDSDGDNDVDSDSDTDVDSDTDSDTDTDTDVDTDTDTDTDVDTDTDTDTDVDTDSDTDADSDTNPDCIDEDSDWWCASLDCNDEDSEIHPNAEEDTDNGIDDDCDGLTDEEPPEIDTGYTGPVIPENCEDATLAMTSVGCDFFMVDVDNWTNCDPETYAVVVSNPQEATNASITVEHGISGELYTNTLAPGDLDVINVACTTGCLIGPQQIEEQGIGTGKGFRLTSDVPILAYQWNPYGESLYSTDASLLIPVASLDGTYITAAWDEGPGATWPYLNAQLTVVATEDDTTITFIPSTNIPAIGAVGPETAGIESDPYYLNQYDVLSMRPTVLDDDLTGTVIQADKPVVLFGGHSCANVPDTPYAACDHVEEQILPLFAWGTSTVLARHAKRQGCSTYPDDPVVWRIIAGADDMTVYFDPAAPAPAGSEYYFAQQGELLQFIGTDDYFAEALLNDPLDPEEPEAPFFAYQMMAGCTYASCASSEGDPMMLQSPPAGQFLDRYVFNTDAVFDFAYDHIIVVREAGTEVTLDCLGILPDSDFDPVGSTDWQVARIWIDNPTDSTGCLDGAHEITADAPFGLSVAGTASANSYGYLGGVGVKPINPNPVIE